MNVVGVHVVVICQYWRAFEQTCPRRAAFAVRRINARDAQDMNGHARAAAVPSQLRLSIDPPLRTRGAGIGGAGLCHPMALAITVDTTGRAIHELAQGAAQSQGTQQGLGARVGDGFSSNVWRWCQMDHMGGNACQSAQRGGMIQIAQQWRDIFLAQFRQPLGRGSQCHNI